MSVTPSTRVHGGPAVIDEVEPPYASSGPDRPAEPKPSAVDEVPMTIFVITRDQRRYDTGLKGEPAVHADLAETKGYLRFTYLEQMVIDGFPAIDPEGDPVVEEITMVIPWAAVDELYLARRHPPFGSRAKVPDHHQETDEAAMKAADR